MLNRLPEREGDPDDVMLGRCMTCNTTVRCRRRECRVMSDGTGFGPMLCAPCPKVVGQTREGADRTCGARVWVSKENRKDD